jgi:hypothetical protein
MRLLSGLHIDDFAYDTNERTLFTIDNRARALHLYTPITCDGSFSIGKHSWSLEHIIDPIHSIEIDSVHGQIIYASKRQFLVANMSEPNATRIIYTSDRFILSFVYGKQSLS